MLLLHRTERKEAFMGKINIKNLNWKKIIIRAAVIGAIGLAGISYYKKSHSQGEVQEAMTSKAVVANVEATISGAGTLSPANQYEVKSLVKGSILQAPFEEGAVVKKGQLLYQISTNDIENNIKASELSVDKAKQSYEDYRTKQENLQVTSKVSGYIKKLYVKEGDAIQAGKVIADIYNGDVLYLDLLFPAGEVSSSWIGKSAKVNLDVSEEVIKGTVTGVSSMTETMEGGILSKKVTLQVRNKGGLKAGDTATASIQDIASSNSGAFRAETEISIVAEAEGKVETIFLKEGEWIQQKEKLLSLSSRDLESQLKNAEIGIKEAELTLNTQRNQEKLYTIVSPIAGQVITKGKKQGDTIDPAIDTQAGPMAIIYDMSYLTFQMNIDELQISRIQKGQKVSITTQAVPGSEFTGMISRISLKGNTNNGVTSYPVIVQVDKQDKLLPGMNVNGRIALEKAEQVLTIPSSALQRNNLVYKKTDSAVENADTSIPKGFVPVEVKTGINDGTNVEIKEGLKAGDEVYVPFDTVVEATETFIDQGEY